MSESTEVSLEPLNANPNTLPKSSSCAGFRVGGGSTKVDLKGTELMPDASGEAKVEAKAKTGTTNIEVTAKGLTPPSKLGAEYLTYVLWVVTPEGRTGNSGELLINKNGEGKLSATTPAQTFSMIVTAGPYFAVRVPSEMVVLETETPKKHEGETLSCQRVQADEPRSVREAWEPASDDT